MTNGLQAKISAGDGWPVADAVLTVTDMTGNQVAREQAGADGVVSAPAQPQGVYTVIVTAPGFDPEARTAMVSASGDCDLGTVTVQRTGGTELPARGVWTIDPVHSTIDVRVRHLGMATVRGHFGEFSGQIEVADPPTDSRVFARIDAASIDTANKMRDDHLRAPDFLNVDQYPEVRFDGRGMTAVGADRWRLHGELTLRGITREVDLDLHYTGTGDDPWGGRRAGFSATAELRREDFGITYNQILSAGIAAVGATLQVELQIEAVLGDSLPMA